MNVRFCSNSAVYCITTWYKNLSFKYLNINQRKHFNNGKVFKGAAEESRTGNARKETGHLEKWHW